MYKLWKKTELRKLLSTVYVQLLTHKHSLVSALQLDHTIEVLHFMWHLYCDIIIKMQSNHESHKQTVFLIDSAHTAFGRTRPFLKISIFFFFSSWFIMKFSHLMYLSLVLCCLVELGKGVRCYQSKNWKVPEVGEFDKSKLEEKTCDSGMLYCEVATWYDDKAKASESSKVFSKWFV